MTQHRLSLCLSATALLVAVFGSTPLGRAATRVVHTVVPSYAKTAGYAKIAGNAALLNGHKAAASGAPGTVVVVGAAGKLPTSIGAVGPAGPAGPAGLSGYEIVSHDTALPANATILAAGAEADCPSGKKVLGGSVTVHKTDGGSRGDWQQTSEHPAADGSGWLATIATGSPVGSNTVATVEAICATVK
jgi:hypothetical protein